ncbi:MAG TPA: hypothetical protein VF552_16585 [Allosphingosinicella sp.]|jgi:hypothetical protein
MNGRLLVAAMLLGSGSAGAQAPVRAPVVPSGGDAENNRRLAALGLTPFERHREIIRYTYTAPEAAGGPAAGLRTVVVQLVPGPDLRDAALTLAVGRTPARGQMQVVSRRTETISLHEYRSLRTQIVRYATDLDMREQEVAPDAARCSGGPSARLDMKLGGESRMVLTRTGGCNAEAAAYDAGDFLLVAAERILGAPIEDARPPR